MSEESSGSGRAWMAGGAVVALLVVGGLLSAILFDEGVQPVKAPEPLPPRPVVKPEAPAGDARARLSLAPPVDRARPQIPDAPVEAPLTPEMRREMNYFVDDIIKAARVECITPWLQDELPEAPSAEFVFDAVLYDGQMYDVGIRSLDYELPDAVRSCIGDQAWSQEVPEIDLAGQIRLQRSATFANR